MKCCIHPPKQAYDIHLLLQNTKSRFDPLSDAWWPGLSVSQARQLLQLLSKIFVKKTFPPRQHDEWWKCCKLTQSFPSGDVPSRVSAVYGQLLGWSSSALTKLKHLFYSSAANALMFLWKKFTKSSSYGNMQSPDDSGRQQGPSGDLAKPGRGSLSKHKAGKPPPLPPFSLFSPP